MNRIHLRFLIAAAVVGLLGVAASEGSAQTTFTACRVPVVGVIYLLAAPADPCLDGAHVKFSWTEGGAPADGSITSAKIADGTVAAVDHAAGSVTTTQILDGTIATADVANGAITQTKLDAGVSFPLADGAVTSAKILDGTIAAIDIAAAAITTAKIAAAAVGSTEVLDNSLTAADIATDGVGAAEIAANAVSTSEIVNGAVTLAKFSAGIVRFANVSGLGAVYGSSGGITAIRQSTGVYALTFTQTLGAQSNCAFVGTGTEGVQIVQTIHGSRYGGGNNEVSVQVFDANASLVNLGFELIVVCAS